MYAIFFNSRRETVQIPIPCCKTVTGKLYRRLAMKTFENQVKKSRPRLGLQSLNILHDNAPAHTSKRILAFFLEERLDNSPAPTLFTRFSPM